MTQTKSTEVELGVHHKWGVAKTYYPSAPEAYAVAEELMAAGWTVSIETRG